MQHGKILAQVSKLKMNNTLEKMLKGLAISYLVFKTFLPISTNLVPNYAQQLNAQTTQTEQKQEEAKKKPKHGFYKLKECEEKQKPEFSKLKEQEKQTCKKPSKSKTSHPQPSKAAPYKTAPAAPKQEATSIIINIYQNQAPPNQAAQPTAQEIQQTTSSVVRKDRKSHKPIVEFSAGYIMEGRTVVNEQQDPQESNQGFFAQTEIMSPNLRIVGNLFWTRNPKTQTWYGGNIINNKILHTNIAVDYILANYLDVKLMLEHASSEFISQDDVSFLAGLPSTSYTLVKAGGGINIPLKDSPDWYAQAIYFFGKGTEKFDVESARGKITQEAVPFNTSGFQARLKIPFGSINYCNEKYDDRDKTLNGAKESFSTTLELPLRIVTRSLEDIYLFGSYFTTSMKDNKIKFDNDGIIVGLGARF